MPFPYLYDPTGILPANRISNELHHVAPPVDLDRANFIVPRAAPYFSNGLVIRTGASVLDPALIEGTDYIFTHHFVEASQHLNTPLYGSVMFLNRMYVGDVYLSYNTIGGAFTLDDYGVVETLTRSLYNIRTVTWDQLLGVPVAFPTIPHPHDVADLTGMADVVVAIQNLVVAVQGQGGNIGSLMSTLVNHIGGMSPHTKDQVGLEYVENFGMAGVPELTTLPANRYTSPEWVWQAIELFNLGEAGVSQATESVVGITRYATDVEVIDQDNPLDTVAVTAAGMWLAIATNTERLAGATIVTGVDFNTPPYREDGYWAFTNAINTSITPSSGYICTKKAGNKAYQTETLDNGEISNRMYTGTAWTPWIRAYIATYYGTLPVNTLNGNIDLNDYLTPGFYVFDTHNVIGNAPPSFGISSLHEMMIYASDTNPDIRCQTVSNLTAGRGAIRLFNATLSNFGPWTSIDTVTGVLPSSTPLHITAIGVWLILSTSFPVIKVTTRPATSLVINTQQHPIQSISTLIDDGLPGRVWSTAGFSYQLPTHMYTTAYLSSGLSTPPPVVSPLNTTSDMLAIMTFVSSHGGANTFLGNPDDPMAPPWLVLDELYSIAGGVLLFNTGSPLPGLRVNTFCLHGIITNDNYLCHNLNGLGFTEWYPAVNVSPPPGDIYTTSISLTDLDSAIPYRAVNVSDPVSGTNVNNGGFFSQCYTVRYSAGMAQIRNDGKMRHRPDLTGVWSPWV